MADFFDPYGEWLGIDPAARPLDHYTLLGVPRFCGDPQLIAAAAQQRLTQLHTLQSGPRGRYAQQLLNELTQALNCLRDARTKITYDAALAGQLSAAARTAPTSAAAVRAVTVSPVVVPPAFPTAPPPPATVGLVAPKKRLVIGIGLALAVGVMCVGLLALLATRRGKPAPVTGPPEVVAAEEIPAEPPVVEVPPATSPPHAKPATEEEPVVIFQEATGEFRLTAAAAQLTGEAIGVDLSAGVPTLGDWKSAEDRIAWMLNVVQPGVFRVELFYATTPAAQGATITLTVDGETKTRAVQASAALQTQPNDEFFLPVRRKGKLRVTLHGDPSPQQEIMRLYAIRLIPAKRVFTEGEKTP